MDKKRFIKSLVYQQMCTGAMALTGSNMLFASVLAAGDPAEQIVNIVFQVIGMAALASGVVMATIGLVQFMMARAEEGGPQETKAINKMVAGLGLVVVGTLLRSSLGDTLAGLITDALSVDP